MPLPTPLAPAEALVVHTARRAVAPGEIFEFTVTSAANPALRALALDFPGFTSAAPAIPGEARFRGRLTRPGFHPFQVTARTAAGAVLTGRDYFIGREPTPATPAAEAGYYVFLGCGDYPIITGTEATHPLVGWTLAQWQELIAWMGAHGLNRFWVLLNGYTLAYPSPRYPTLRDPHARNVTDNFLRELIDFAHAHAVQVYLMLTTDGHARAFSRLHPEAARLNAAGQPCHHFGLALEHSATQRYLFDVLDEVLALYPNADGLAVHPTESDPDRFNPETVAAYRAETGRDLTATPQAERYAWYNRAYARFLRAFFGRARERHPHLAFVMANCWWQDDYVAINHAELPADVRIAVWYYAWEDTEPKDWFIHRWLRFFPPERLIYLPTSQSYLYPTDPARVMDRHLGTDRLVSTARVLGVKNTLYFAGWDILAEEARLLDAALVRTPAADLAPAADRALIPALYRDYLGTRRRLLAR